MTLGIHHVQISVAPDQIEASRHFYIALLGCTPIRDPFEKPGFWIAAGLQEVHVRPEADIDRARTAAHPAFLVNDLDVVRERLVSEGRDIIPQPKLEGFERFHVLDPSGNRLEIMQRV